MFYLINYKKNEKEKKFMLPCMAAVAIAMFVGAKVMKPIDTANVFRKCNPLFSQDYDRQLHNFVINKDNKVVMIGNPLKSYKLEETLRKLIDGRSSY